MGALEILDLHSNRLTGSIPGNICKCSKLKILNLGSNCLTGPIPPEIGKCTALEELHIHCNTLTGVIPATIGQCTMLKVLSLTKNNLGGSIPAELGNCREMEMLILSYNSLTEHGGVPQSLDALTSLQTLYLTESSIHGPFGARKLFERMCNDPKAVLNICGNSFDAFDFGDDKFTEGTLRDYFGNQSYCIASFCGTEFMDWQKLLLRSSENTDCSQLCVLLPTYATATKAELCDAHWHAGGRKDSPECKELGQYFEAAASVTKGESRRRHDMYGCVWFERWANNIRNALSKGHDKFLVVTAVDGTVGVCQTVEWLFLKDLQRQHAQMDIRTMDIKHLDLVVFNHGEWGTQMDSGPPKNV